MLHTVVYKNTLEYVLFKLVLRLCRIFSKTYSAKVRLNSYRMMCIIAINVSDLQ